jgi:hypothetical protein
MLEPDTTTSQVLMMYIGMFVFFFVIIGIVFKKNS